MYLLDGMYLVLILNKRENGKKYSISVFNFAIAAFGNGDDGDAGFLNVLI